jgi:hypothetical protein
MPKFKITRVKSVEVETVIEGNTLFEALSSMFSSKKKGPEFDMEKGMTLMQFMNDENANGLITMKQAQSLISADGILPSVVGIKVEGDRPTTA